MKRAALLLVTALLCICSLTSCIIIPIYKNHNISPDTVSCIQIYDLRNCDSGDYYGAFIRTQEPACELSGAEAKAFLQDLSDIQFSDHIIIVLAAIDPSFAYGEWAVCINYTDGSRQYISSSGYGETFDSNGEIIESDHFSPDIDEWNELIGKYVPEDIFNAQP